jgi:hypothetical protein
VEKRERVFQGCPNEKTSVGGWVVVSKRSLRRQLNPSGKLMLRLDGGNVERDQF